MQVEVLAYYYAWALLGYITRWAFRPLAVKKKLGSCSISFLVHPGRSPGILLCLSASKLYNTFRISTRSRKKKITVVLYPLWFIPVEVLAWYNYARALLGYISRLAFQSEAVKKKNLGSCSISFLVHPGRSPGMLLCLSASRIYNTFSISTRSRKNQLESCSISFLVHPGRTPGMISLSLSASTIYNTFSISTRSRKNN